MESVVNHDRIPLQNDEELAQLAATIPTFPFKGVEKFYDVSGLLQNPAAFRLCIKLLSERYAALNNVTSIGGFDARGFLFGPSIAAALDKPFFMIRKQGKLPNAISGAAFKKEYKGDNAQGEDVLEMSRSAIKPGDRVVLIDDLVATGGTICAGIELVQFLGGIVVECACIVELGSLNGRGRIQSKYPDVPIFSLLDEALFK